MTDPLAMDGADPVVAGRRHFSRTPSLTNLPTATVNHDPELPC